MNPNSTHQLWSLWTSQITMPHHRTHDDPAFQMEMKRAVASVYRRMFGSVTEIKIDYTRRAAVGRHNTVYTQTQFVVQCRTEGSPAPDPKFRKMQMDALAKFYGDNLRRYGQVKVHVEVKIEAGDAGDGKPPSQLILAPSIVLEEYTHGEA